MSDSENNAGSQNVGNSDVINCWLKTSLENAFNYLSFPLSAIEQEFPVLLNQLDSLYSFRDIFQLKNSLEPTSNKPLEWCGNVNQELFDSQDAIHLVFINQFKTACIDKIYSLCDTANERHSDFISALNDFLNLVHFWHESQKNFYAELGKNYLEKNSNNERELIKSLTESCNNFGSKAVTNKEFVQAVMRFRELANKLLEDEVNWTAKLKLQIRIICKKLLFPLLKIEEKEENGRKIVVVKGSDIVISQIKSQIEELISGAEEVHMVGLNSVHVDCDLENNVWHGINVVVISDKLFVVNTNRNAIQWDVSGRNDGNESPEKAKNGQLPGDDGTPGEHGLPGESGGNVFIQSNEIFNAENWKIISNGGQGKNGQNGGDGNDGDNGKDARPKSTKDEFRKIFSPLINCPKITTKSSFKKIHKKFKKQINSKGENRTYPKDRRSEILIDGCSVVTMSYYKRLPRKTNLRFILWKGEKGTRGKVGGQGGEGGKGGKGGYAGSINIQKGYKFIVPGPQIPETTNIDGENGLGGEDGAGGNCGKHGKSTADVGYIVSLYHNPPVWVKSQAYYIGFRSDKHLEINYKHINKNELPDFQHPYTKCKVNGEKIYAVLSSMTYTQDFMVSQEVAKTTDGRQCQTIQEAVRKTPISHQNLIQHLAQIIERKYANQRLTSAMNIDEIVNQTMALLDVSSPSYQRYQDANNKINNPEIVYQRSLSSRYTLFNDSEFQTECDTSIKKFVDGYTFRQVSINEDELKAMENLDVEVKLNRFIANDYLEGCLSQVSQYLEPQPIINSEANSQLEAIFSQNDQSTIYDNVKELVKKRISIVNPTQQPDDMQSSPQTDSQETDNILLSQSTISENAVLNKKIERNFIKNQTKKFKKQSLADLRSKDDNFTLITAHENVGRTVGNDNYDDHNDDTEAPTFRFHNEYLSTSKKKNIILLRKNNQGVWQRLDCKPQVRKYCDQRIQQIAKFRDKYNKKTLERGKVLSTHRPTSAPTTSDLEAHRELLKWLKDKTTENNLTVMNQITTSVKMLNPEYGCTPGELSRILLIQLEKESEMSEQLTKDVGFLAEKVVEYDSRNVDPIFYLSIVDSLVPYRWKYEFVLVEIEERMMSVLKHKDRAELRKTLYKFDNKILSVLHERLRAAGVPGSRKIKPEILKQTLEIMADQVSWTNEDVISLSRLSLNDWLYDLKDKIWRKEVDELYENQEANQPEGEIEEETELKIEEEKKEAVYLLLELENKSGENFYYNEVIKKLQNPTAEKLIKKFHEHLYYDDEPSYEQSTPEERDHNKIINMIGKGKNVSKSILNIHKNSKIKKRLFLLDAQTSTNKQPNQEKNKKEQNQQSHQSLIELIHESNQERNNKPEKPVFVPDKKQIEIEKFLYDYIIAVRETLNFELRDTQRVTIFTLLMNENNTLGQVLTGEGKSLIVTALAIYHVHCSKKKVDVITINNILAKRDSSLSKDFGGLKELYQHFNINVAHNCSEKEDDRMQAYKSDVVYGELSNFQRDYLLDEFYGRNIRGGRQFDCVVVDEVDCMLLDRGNNMLYLTHDIPGMEMLESLYVFIWEKIRTTTDKLEKIKSAILFDLYGEVTMDDLGPVLGSQMEEEQDQVTLWSHLIKSEIINQQGRLLIQNEDKLKEELFNYSTDLNPKLVFFFRKVLERERHIRIPQHLLSFVDRHLDNFLDNAVRALNLNADEHYVVDHNRTGNSPDHQPQVIIIDPDTGTDQTMSQWDEGLHQFLQLKEGCRLTLQSLKSVFISNLTYINRYHNLDGLTGTLGSKPEREFLLEMYKCDFFSVPTAFPKRFTIETDIVVKTEEQWFQAIIDETDEILKKNRSLLIFCRTIKLVKIVYEQLKPRLGKNIHYYKRDHENLSERIKNELCTGKVIVATNLAGRGLDIKISDKLRKNGGLHVCLTYLPENVRVGEQAMGRAGRQGDKGSSRIILYEPDNSGNLDKEWPKSKIYDMKKKRNRIELQRVSQLSDDYTRRIEKEEICFNIFRENYKKLVQENTSERSDVHVTDAICSSVLDQWALWLDQIDYSLTLKSPPVSKIEQQLNNEIINNIPTLFSLYENMSKDTNDLKWITPARSIILAQHLATHTEYLNLEKAALLLDKLIESNDGLLYPAAHYYMAFIYMKETCGFKKDTSSKSQKNNFSKMLRAAETFLKQHIDMQIEFSAIVSRFRTGEQNSHYFDDGYKGQKANTVQLLSYFISSIHSLIGSRFSVSDLQEAVIDVKSAKTYFDQLVEANCIVNCQVNDLNTVPNRDQSLKEIAKEYGVDLGRLKAFLPLVNNTSEEETIMILQKTDMILGTRREFWDWLVQNEALLLPNSNQISNLVSDFKDPNLKYVLFDPTPENINNFLKGEKLPNNVEYATLQMTKLKEVELKHFSRLISKDDLSAVDITNKNEIEKIWKALIEQNILTDDGSLSLNYKAGITKFIYSDCPIYEHAATSLIERTYVAEIIRRQWLEETDPVSRFEIINCLSLDPYQDILCDLQAAHIISGNRVTEEDIIFENIAKEITRCSEEQHRICRTLLTHRAEYANWETPKASLGLIQSSISQTDDENTEEATKAELYTFKLAGFTQVIKTSDKKWTTKKFLRYFSIIAIGITKIGVSIALPIIPGLSGLIDEIKNSITMESFLRGIKDIELVVSALRSGHNLTWADYRRRMFKDLTISTTKWRTDTVSHFYNSVKNKSDTTVSGQSVKNVIKNIIELHHSTVSQNMAIERIIVQIECKEVIEKLEILFRQLETDLKQKVQSVVDSNIEIHKKLIELYQFKERAEVEVLANDILEQLMSDAKDDIQNILNKMLKNIPSIHVDKIKNHEFSLKDEIYNNVERILNGKLVHKLGKISAEQIDNFNKKMEKNSSPSNSYVLTNNVPMTIDELQRMLTFKLLEEIEKTMKLLEKGVEEIVGEAIANYSAICLLRLDNQQLKQWCQRINQMLICGDGQQQPSRHIQCCLKLMRKTKDPKLLAALIRENGIPDEDSFIQAGLQNVMSQIQENYPELTLTSVKSSQEAATLIETDSIVANAIRFGWRNYVNQKCPFELFPICEMICTNETCALRGLNDYIGYGKYVKQAFVGESERNSFDNTRKSFLNLDDVPSAIWLNITTFILPVVNRLHIGDERRNEFLTVAEKHLEDFKARGKISETELIQLTQHLKVLEN